MAVSHRITLAIAVFTALICGGYSIHCFYCNSANNSACLDIHKYDEETVARIVPVVECKVHSPGPTEPEFFCRKIVQTIFKEDREAEVRVTRGCGWVRSQKSCYRANNADHLETACQCFTDICNAADSVDPATPVVTFLAFSAVLYFYR